MPAALGSFGSPSKILKIPDFPQKILPDSWNFSKFFPGSRKSAPRARRPAQNLPDRRILSKPTASSGPRNSGSREPQNPKKMFCVECMISESLIAEIFEYPSDFDFPQPNEFFESLAPPPDPMVIDREYTRLLPQGLTSRLPLRNR